MWPEDSPFRGAKATVLVDGKPIGTTQLITSERAYTSEPLVMTPITSGTIEMQNASINMEALRQMLPKVDLEHKVTNYPRKRNLPKKKRIRNKWGKKYLVSKTVYHDVTLMEAHEIMRREQG